jgi:hypothetical protein
VRWARWRADISLPATLAEETEADSRRAMAAESMQMRHVCSSARTRWVGRGDESEAVEGLVLVAVAEVVERLVAAVKRVKGFEAGRAGGGGDSELGFGRGETSVLGTAAGHPTEPDWGSGEDRGLNREKMKGLSAKLRPQNAGRA